MTPAPESGHTSGGSYSPTSSHGLEAEFEDRVRQDPSVLATICKTVADGIWYCDLRQPHQRWISPSFWRLLGFDGDTARPGQIDIDALAFSDNPDLFVIAAAVSANGDQSTTDLAMRFRHINGSTVSTRCRAIYLCGEHGLPDRLLVAHICAPNHHKALEETRKAQSATIRAQADRAALRGANEELRAFAYAASHDLKSPAQTIAMLLDELISTQTDRLDDDGRDLLALSRESVGHMQRLIADLVDYTRLIEHDPIFELIELTPLIDRVIASLRAKVVHAGITVYVSAMPTVWGNGPQLGILFQNLIENAIKYRRTGAPGGPWIKVYADINDHAVALLKVEDNGIGIPYAAQQKIFKMFKRLHRAEEMPGNGLGLATCRRIVLNHCGAIAVRSIEGQGTIFTVSLPGAED